MNGSAAASSQGRAANGAIPRWKAGGNQLTSPDFLDQHFPSLGGGGGSGAGPVPAGPVSTVNYQNIAGGRNPSSLQLAPGEGQLKGGGGKKKQPAAAAAAVVEDFPSLAAPTQRLSQFRAAVTGTAGNRGNKGGRWTTEDSKPEARTGMTALSRKTPAPAPVIDDAVNEYPCLGAPAKPVKQQQSAGKSKKNKGKKKNEEEDAGNQGESYYFLLKPTNFVFLFFILCIFPSPSSRKFSQLNRCIVLSEFCCRLDI